MRILNGIPIRDVENLTMISLNNQMEKCDKFPQKENMEIRNEEGISNKEISKLISLYFCGVNNMPQWWIQDFT